MRLFGKIIKNNITIAEATVEEAFDEVAYIDALEICFVQLCHELDIPIPLWLRSNTKQFAGYRKTFFTRDQFIEKVKFDKLIIEAE